ncbi:tRNA lysidine(34) synthetase TilS [Mycetocola zhadangensis]|uniref:tRNA(Ile)-lysidine synthase n=1 Tax=Mycetocola zhadangensis TaxID=1164595 RepID=A0A3L7J2E6_9MICO|nr:tRNA lysidine(34) synthetase TilS [Mycetocola zhadangensis]RLQ84589.1 tRNA lysidine(34) synthetase TilS [Mycetocola zhadangensis]GGE91613.1 tRNA(Ile)-lysidine synthase [Mycetocola zhadangensis]
MPTNSNLRRPPLDKAVAEVRLAVRQSLSGNVNEGETVLVALSGGPDSLALAAATAFEAVKQGISAGAVIVDHGLQERSADVASHAANQARALGLNPVIETRVQVADAGGPEAAARTARYEAFESALAGTGASALLLGHTLDDQAETVLLGLARGSGSGSLMGMAPVSGRYLRPLLGVRRESTHAACAAEGLEPWIDPHNTDQAFTRVRVREKVLPVLERELGPGIAEALARTAEQLREDTEAFDSMIDEFIEEICEPAEAGIAVSISALAANPAALRNRIIRMVALSEFGQSLSRMHTIAIAALVTDWRGQGPIDVPGISVRRNGGLLEFSARAPEVG